MGEDFSVDLVGNGGHQGVTARDRIHQLLPGKGPVFQVQPRVEQLAHTGFHGIGEPSGDDDVRLSRGHGGQTSKNNRVRQGLARLCSNL